MENIFNTKKKEKIKEKGKKKNKIEEMDNVDNKSGKGSNFKTKCFYKNK